MVSDILQAKEFDGRTGLCESKTEKLTASFRRGSFYCFDQFSPVFASQQIPTIYSPHDKLMIMTHDHAWPIEPPAVLL